MRTRLSTAVSVCVAAAALAAQPPSPNASAGRDQAPQSGVASPGSPQPTFRTGANYVRVDMYATRDGQPVQDITAQELEVLEDGVPQKIEAFEHVVVRPAGAQELRNEPDGLTASRQAAADPRARVFVIFLDTYHTQLEGSANMRLPLGRFLDRVLGPDDLVAVMTPEMAASDIAFGRKTTVISDMMQTEWWGRRARIADDDPKEELYEVCGLRMGLAPGVIAELKARRREKLTLDALEDLIGHLGGIREERKAVLAVTEGWVLFRENAKLSAPGREGPATPQVFRPPVAPPTERGTLTQPMTIECEADRMALSMVDHDTKLRRIGEEANRGNVTFYPVFARGLVPFDAPIGPERPPSLQQDSANLRTRQDSLRALAVDTDGEAVINTNDIDGALKRIVDDLSSYYLFGYYSTNSKLDGRFRSITVRVKRPGVRVRARRGYRGRTAEDLISSAGAPDPGAAAVTVALNAVVGVNARSSFRIRPSAWARAVDGASAAGTMWIVGEIDYRTRRELAWTAGAHADVVVLAADGTPVASRELDVPAAAGSFAIQVPETGSLPSGEYAVRVRLRPESDADLAVSDTVRVIVPDGRSSLGEAVLWRRGPSTGTQYVRTADPRFQRSERIRLELATADQGAATARMLDRTGRPMQVPVRVSERTEPSGEFRWLVVDATLAPLGAGEYAIEVVQGTAKQITGFSVVP